MRWFFNSPAPNLPRGRGRSRDSHPARGEGWGGGAMFKSLRIGTYQLFTPSVRFPLPAGGTAWTRGSVPLAKRGEPAGGGHFINSECAIGIIPIAGTQFTKTSAIEDPLLKVPPASRGNRTRARFPSRSGGNLQEGGNCKLRPRDWYYTQKMVILRISAGHGMPRPL